MKPTMFIADISPRDTPWHKAFPVRSETYGYCYSEYVTLSAANAAIEERDKRIAELERELDEATETLRYCEQQWAEERGTMIDKFVFERARAEAAEALLKEEIEQRDTWTDNDRAKAWRAVFDSTHQRAMTAEAKLSQLLSYVPEECFEGGDRWELVKCKRSGGAWFGAEDFRAARSLAAKIGGKDE